MRFLDHPDLRYALNVDKYSIRIFLLQVIDKRFLDHLDLSYAVNVDKYENFLITGYRQEVSGSLGSELCGKRGQV
jgi:hypothetical protein